MEELEDETIQETDEIDDLLVVSMHMLSTKTVKGCKRPLHSMAVKDWVVDWLTGTKTIAICLKDKSISDTTVGVGQFFA